MKLGKNSIEIYFMGETGDIYKSDSLKNLLPFMFDKTSCKKKKSLLILLLDGMSYFATANLCEETLCVIGTS
jgi:hypothetical protein